MDYPWLEGKGVLITGAAGGIGKATVDTFLANGATVLGMDLTDSWSTGLTDKPTGAGQRLHAVSGDATDSAAVERAVRALVSIHGSIDVAVAAAGIQAVGSVEDTAEEVWQRVININLTGTWLLCKHAVAAMKRGNGGTILLLGSTSGLHPRANLAAYCVSKAGVSMLARVLARESAADGIRVVAVCPTGTETPLLRDMIAGLEERQARVPAGAVAASPARPERSDSKAEAGLLEGRAVQHWLSTAEVAGALAWLTSPAASMVTGSSIPLDFGSV